jgi:predicted kinase
LPATYLRIDSIERGMKSKTEIPEFGEKCYFVAQLQAQENLQLGNSVIADMVNPWELTRNAWNNVAKSAGANFVNIEVACSDKNEHKKRLESRSTTVPGLRDPTWKEVQEREYQPWGQDRILLDTSGKSIDTSFEELLSNLKISLKLKL